MKEDESIELTANNLLYLSNQYKKKYIDFDIIYSILEGKPKRADAYWFVDFRVLPEPYGGNYTVETFGTDFIFKIIIRLGFKEEQRLDMYMYNIAKDLIESGELPHQKQKHTMLTEDNAKILNEFFIEGVGTTKFILIRKILLANSEVRPFDRVALMLQHLIRNIVGNPES